MKQNIKSKQTSTILGLLALVAIVNLAPHAFAQQNPAGQGQQNGVPLGGPYSSNGVAPATSGGGSISYTDADNPYGPMSTLGWAGGLVTAGVLSGIGVWSAVRKH